jgi:hypothetical protein
MLEVGLAFRQIEQVLDSAALTGPEVLDGFEI